MSESDDKPSDSNPLKITNTSVNNGIVGRLTKKQLNTLDKTDSYDAMHAESQ